MKKIDEVMRKNVLLPQSFGDRVKWYGYRVYYVDMDALGTDMSHSILRDDVSEYKRTLAVGQVGYDALPTLGVNRPQAAAGKCATGEAVTYLLRELHLTDDDIFTDEERHQGWSIGCDIAPNPTLPQNVPGAK